MQVDLELRVRVAGVETLGADFEVDAQLFSRLAPQGVLIRLVPFDLSSREFPEKRAMLARWSLLNENTPPLVAGDEGRDHPHTAGGCGHPEPRGRFISRE